MDASPGIDTAVAVEGAAGRNEDRAAVFDRPEGRVLVVADGAGGIAGGAEAAEAVVAGIRRAVESADDVLDADMWVGSLRQLDIELWEDPEAGETTAVVAAVGPGRIAGASAGDSGTLLVGPEDVAELTRNQPRRPFLGAGAARAEPFSAAEWRGRLLLATDGLLKYAGRASIAETARTGGLQAAAEALVDLVRLGSGALQDDVAVVLCERR
ncbi:MAG: protein phosphatase 2C domain-containing protein [Planctomycetota bacterium]